MSENRDLELQQRSTFGRVKFFVNDFFNHSGIHGFSYIGDNFNIHIVEKLFWFLLVCFGVFFCVDFSLESWNKYLHKSTVVSVQRDYYYWNRTTPSLTICPMSRLNRDYYDKYAETNRIPKPQREEFFQFLESLANSTFINFDAIKNTSTTDVILEQLGIQPKDYMMLIYQLTEDLTKRNGSLDEKVRCIANNKFLGVYQVLTENGICYSAANNVAKNISTSWLLESKMPVRAESYGDDSEFSEVKTVNMFEGDTNINFIGFFSAVNSYFHSSFEILNVARGDGWTQDSYDCDVDSVDIVTSDQFRQDTFISQRRCRFPKESNLTHYRYYTRRLCFSECRISLAMKYCHCIPHFYPNRISKPKPVCSYHQLKTCFPNKADLFLEFNGAVVNESQINCYCLQNCIDANVVMEKRRKLQDTKQYLSGQVGILMQIRSFTPYRYERQVIYTLTDFFVSVGGTAGLFTGLSVLGFIEIFYYFTLRLFWFLFKPANPPSSR